jgi:hypothetical protein
MVAHPSYGELQLPVGTVTRGGSSKQAGLVRAVSAAAGSVPQLGAVARGTIPTAAARDARSPVAGGTMSPTDGAVPRSRVATAVHSSVRWADQGAP